MGAAWEDAKENDDAMIGIDREYRHKLWALRFLPRRDRPAAFRAAREWRQLALRALREKRAIARYARKLLRRLRRPMRGAHANEKRGSFEPRLS